MVLWDYLPIPGEEAVTARFAAWAIAMPEAGVLAFVPEDEQGAVGVLQRAARQAGLPLMGAVFPELIVHGAFQRRGILLLVLQSMPPYRLIEGVASGAAGSDSLVQALADLAEAGRAASQDPATLFMVFDALVGNIGSLVDQLYLEIGDMVAYAGVNAGSETFQPMPCLFDHERLVQGGILAFPLTRHPGAVLEHCYKVPESLMTATSVAGNRIAQIDWEPAFEKYQQMVMNRYGTEVTPENFYRMGVHFPFALMRADGEVLVRIPVAVDADGALFCVGEIPDNALVTVVKAVSPGQLDTVDRVLARLGDLGSDETLLFYCAGRRMHLEAAAGAELSALSERVAPKPLLGALSLGEIGNARATGYPLFHNATIVALPWHLHAQP
jgi:hypothetical protein